MSDADKNVSSMGNESGLFPKGSLIAKAEPYVHILCESERGTRCDWCFKTPSRLRHCSRCSSRHYCQVSCQKSDWRFHKKECKHLKRLAPRVPSDSMRLFHRMLLRHQWGDHLKEKAEFGGVTRTFDDLMSHMDSIKADRTRMKGFLTLCTALQAFTSGGFPFPPAHEALTVFGKMVINSFYIGDCEMNSVGLGLYLGAAMLDHSCQPNAVCVFEGTELFVRCLSPTPIPLEEVRMSYIEVLASTQERQQELLQQYYFTCTCLLCHDKERDELLSSVVCPQCQGSIPQTEEGTLLACRECQFKPTNEDLASQACTFVAQAKQAQQKMKTCMKTKGYDEMLSLAEQQLSRMEGVLHGLHAACVRCRDAALNAAIGLLQMEKAAQYSQQNTAAYRQYYPALHPRLGLRLLMLAKIQLYLDRQTDAQTNLQQAAAILSVTHGSSHSLMETLKQLTEECDQPPDDAS